MNFTPHQTLMSDRIKGSKMGGARGTHGREDKCIQGFGGET